MGTAGGFTGWAFSRSAAAEDQGRRGYAGWIESAVTKGRGLLHPLTDELRAELLGLHQESGQPTDGWIFPSPHSSSSPRQDFRRALEGACRRAGLPRIHPHALRHTWASRLAMQQVSRWALMELGGWKDGRVLDEIYAHVTPDHLAEIAARTGIAPPPEIPPAPPESQTALPDRTLH